MEQRAPLVLYQGLRCRVMRREEYIWTLASQGEAWETHERTKDEPFHHSISMSEVLKGKAE